MKLFAHLVGIIVGSAIGFSVFIGTIRYLEGRDVLTGNKPVHVAKYQVGDCIAYYMSGKRFQAKEEWEVSRDIPAFLTLEITKVGKEKYLTITRYSKDNHMPVRPNLSEWIRSIDTIEGYEKIDCKDVESVLEDK